MKKFFTLIAVVLTTVCANAQQIFIPAAADAPSTITTETWTLKSEDGSLSLALFSSKAGISASSKNYISSIYTSDTDETHVRTLANVYKFGGSVTSDNGRVFTVTVPSAGQLAIYSRISSSGKTFKVTATDSKGTATTLTHDDATYTVGKKTCYLGETFDVEAGEVKITTAGDCNMNLAGIEFFPGEATAINTVNANAKANVAKKHLENGRIVIENNGSTYSVAGQIVK